MYITILVKTVYLFISQVSGERLQDHWSSGLLKNAKDSHIFSTKSNSVFASEVDIYLTN